MNGWRDEKYRKIEKKDRWVIKCMDEWIKIERRTKEMQAGRKE